MKKYLAMLLALVAIVACKVTEGGGGGDPLTPPVTDPVIDLFILNARGTYDLNSTPMLLVDTVAEGKTYKVGDIIKESDNTVMYTYTKQYTDTRALYLNTTSSKYNVVEYDASVPTLKFLGDFTTTEEGDTAQGDSVANPIPDASDKPTVTPIDPFTLEVGTYRMPNLRTFKVTKIDGKPSISEVDGVVLYSYVKGLNDTQAIFKDGASEKFVGIEKYKTIPVTIALYAKNGKPTDTWTSAETVRFTELNRYKNDPVDPLKPVLLEGKVNWADLKIHGVYRQYKYDTSKGDQTRAHTGLKDGTDVQKYFDINPNYLKDGYEYPTPGYRLPLTIHANNDDTTKGLYSIWDKGTSFLFPQPYTGDHPTRAGDKDQRKSTAGLYIAIKTDSPTIVIDYDYFKLGARGRERSGVDVYEVNSGQPTYKDTILDGSIAKKGTVTVYTGATLGNSKELMFLLPTYNGFDNLDFTFEAGAKSYSAYPYNENKVNTQKPILVYGTSIDQGDGAEGLRPGLTMWSRVMRATQREVINLGVAGSSMMEYKMADFLTNIEAEIFIMNPGWNLTASSVNGSVITADSANGNGGNANMKNEEIIKRALNMITSYRAAHKDTPIIVMSQLIKQSDKVAKLTTDLSKVPGADATINPDGYYYSRESALLKTAYTQAINEGVTKLYFLDQKIDKAMYDGDKQGFPNFIDNAGALHYGDKGMLDSAKFILQEIKASVPDVYFGDVNTIE